MNFGERLKQLRQQREWSQPELAEAIAMEQSYLSKLENSKSIPSPEMLERILAAFDLQIEKFLEGIDDSEVRNHLNSLPQVSDHLKDLEQSSFRSSRRWLIASALFCVLGIANLAPAIFGMGLQVSVYEYSSNEIVPMGDAGETFESLEAFMEKEFVEVRADIIETATDLDRGARDEAIDLAWDEIKARYASLAVSATITEYEYQGQSFVEHATGSQDLINLQAANQELSGTRTFELYDTRSVMQEEMRSLSIFTGAFFLALGVFGFILEHLLYRRR